MNNKQHAEAKKTIRLDLNDLTEKYDRIQRAFAFSKSVNTSSSLKKDINLLIRNIDDFLTQFSNLNDLLAAIKRPERA